MNGEYKKLIKEIELNYNSTKVFQGFRENEKFISAHKNLLTALSDKNWRSAKYMNTEKNISSPTGKIIERYFVNIFCSILFENSSNDLNKIIIKKAKEYSLDDYSYRLLKLVKLTTNIKIEEKEVCGVQANILTPSIMRTAVKRGLYDEFTYQSYPLEYIYRYFKSIFLTNNYSLKDLIQKYKELSNKSDKYINWLLIKAVINRSIREKDKTIAKEFIQKLKIVKVNEFDYINSKSFYILVFESREKAIDYLKDRLDIHNFLISKKIDYSESLAMKNFATILNDDEPIKRKILIKCLEQTPQDVDLWKLWFKHFASKIEIQRKSLDMIDNGYSDLPLYKNIVLTRDMQSALIRLIILSDTPENRKLGYSLINKVDNKGIGKSLSLLYSNIPNISEYIYRGM